jgi:hypothetical protein
MSNLAIGVASALVIGAFIVFVVSPLYRLYHGAPETEKYWAMDTRRTRVLDDGKPHPHFRHLGNMLLAVYAVIGILAATIAGLWLLGAAVKTFILMAVFI